MIDKYDCDDFLEFVAKADGRMFKQGSKMREFHPIITDVELDKVIEAFADKIKQLEKRITVLEREQQAKEDGWQADEWGNFRLPPSK